MEEGTGNDMSEVTIEMVELLRKRKSVLIRPEGPVICKAAPFLRNLKREHFESTVISLGLFDRWSWIGFKDMTTGKDVTRERDSLKIDVLIAFLADIDKGPEHWAEISKKVVDDPSATKKLYDQRLCFDLPDETVRYALALDSIFVACFLMVPSPSGLVSSVMIETKKCLFQETNSTLAGLYHDVLKMENQIPLELIRKVLAIVVQFARANPTLVESVNIQEDLHPGRLLQTLCSWPLELYHGNLPGELSKSGYEIDDHNHLLHYVAKAFWDQGGKVHDKKQSHENDRLRDLHLPAAEELYRRGIRFERQADFVPRFKKNRFAPWKVTLFLPKVFFIGDKKEQQWRNLLAFEDMWFGNPEEMLFTQYLIFMDNLINTERDVSLLLDGKNPVIGGVGIGDNRAVSDFFNSMTINIPMGPVGEWGSIVREINDFYHNTFGSLFAEFLKTYTSKPWLVISVLAAFILLVGTLVQTVYTVQSYYNGG